MNNEWQPIETAPKDGGYVLLCTKDGFRSAGFYVNESEEHESFWCLLGAGALKPTHWMPLPAPPAD